MPNQAKAFGSEIGRLINGEDLSRQRAKEMFDRILLNEETEMQQGAFLAALTAKGETAEEIAGSWESIYEQDAVKVKPEVSEPLVENCGTGMDDLNTFNISTAASIVAAAGGVTMAKHGSRAITSVCGTIDILEMLGVDVECEPELVKESIEEAGIGIFNGMSPKVHPQALGRILSKISFGTTLNIAASLANPVMPTYGVRGVYSKELVSLVAQVMREIGYQKAIVVHGLAKDGSAGMDEASTLGKNIIAELGKDGRIEEYSFRPGDIGINPAESHEIEPASSGEEEVLRFMEVLIGRENGAREDIVALNSGLIFYLMDENLSIKDGYQKSKEIINSGQAVDQLREWVKEQNTDSEEGLTKLNGILDKVRKEE